MATKKERTKSAVSEAKKKKIPPKNVPQGGDQERFDRLLDDAIFGIKPKQVE